MKRAVSPELSASMIPLKKRIKSQKADSEKRCAGIFLKYCDSIFMVQPTGSSGYGIPKGHVEAGENMEECARREFQEETGIDMTSIPLVYLEGSADINGGKKIHAFIGTGDGSERFIHSNLITEGFRVGQPENSCGRYFPLDEAALVVHKNQAKLLQLYKDAIKAITDVEYDKGEIK